MSDLRHDPGGDDCLTCRCKRRLVRLVQISARASAKDLDPTPLVQHRA